MLRGTNFWHLLVQPAEHRMLTNDKAHAADAKANHSVVIEHDRSGVREGTSSAGLQCLTCNVH